jgi:hypothetical protein
VLIITTDTTGRIIFWISAKMLQKSWKALQKYIKGLRFIDFKDLNIKAFKN